ncbi:MAG: photosystem II biogenesis protein Psp29 [Cyanobacteria bacterium J06641_5]
MNTVLRTLSDTKRSFYTQHQRPINSLYRRVVEELLVEMHLLSVNVEFRYDPFYALGVITAYDRFMTGYPEADRESIFAAICSAVEEDATQFRQDADAALTAVGPLSEDGSLDWLAGGAKPDAIPDALHQNLQAIATSDRYKYSRLFAIGIYAVLERVSPELVADAEKRQAALDKICTALKLPIDKMAKDLTLFRENLEKLAQARQVLEDTIAASRKQRERREAEKAEKAAAAEAEQDENTTPADDPAESAAEATAPAPKSSEEQ